MAADPFLSELASRLDPHGLLLEASDRERYEHGWRYGRGVARAVARPRDTAEVAAVVALCHRHGVRLVPQGANTGLVAASTPDAGGRMLVLSLERCNRTIEIDAADRVAVVDGGVTLSQLNAVLQPHGLWFPIDLGADPQIGGMVATNTGGTRLLKYGDVRKNLLGLEVVLGDGRVLTQLQRLRKNNTGLDAKQLFVGTFGAFGVVTRAVLQLAPLPRQRATALVGCADGDAVVALLGALERELGDTLSAFEVMSDAALTAVFAQHGELRRPFPVLPAYSVLVEASTTLPATSLDLSAVLEERLGAHLEVAGESIVDVVLGKGEEFWHLRHLISESLRSAGRMLAFDVAVPRSRLPAFTREVAALLAARFPFVRLCDYGHWGDGGTHLNLVWDEAAAPLPHAELVGALQDHVYELAVVGHAGSYSAEHGVGPHNQRYYERFTAAEVRRLCDDLAASLVPGGALGRVRLGTWA